MKKITLLVVLLAAFSMLVSCFGGLGVPQKKVHTQEASDQVLASDEVSIVVSSDGFSKDEAVKTALRSAIEQTFGAFVSSNTTVLNDQLINDEIVSLSNGNVKSYEILTENTLPNNRYYVTLRATICMNKLVNYINSNSKSSMVEVNMDAFDKNIRLAEMNRIAEKKVIVNLISQIKSMDNLFDFGLSLEDPKVDGNSYLISGKVLIKYNQNTQMALQLLRETLEQLKMSEVEVKQYESMGLHYFKLSPYFSFTGCLRNGFMKYDDRNELLRCTYISSSRDRYSFLEVSDRLFTERFKDYQIGDNVSMPSQLTIVSGQQYGGDCFNRVWYDSKGDFRGESIASELTDGSYSNYDNVFFDFPCQDARLVSTWLYSKLKEGDIIAYCEIKIYIPRDQASKYNNFVIQPKTKK